MDFSPTFSSELLPHQRFDWRTLYLLPFNWEVQNKSMKCYLKVKKKRERKVGHLNLVFWGVGETGSERQRESFLSKILTPIINSLLTPHWCLRRKLPLRGTSQFPQTVWYISVCQGDIIPRRTNCISARQLARIKKSATYISEDCRNCNLLGRLSDFSNGKTGIPSTGTQSADTSIMSYPIPTSNHKA